MSKQTDHICTPQREQNEMHVLVHCKNTKQQNAAINAYTRGSAQQSLLTAVPTFMQTFVQNTIQMQNPTKKLKISSQQSE